MTKNKRYLCLTKYKLQILTNYNTEKIAEIYTKIFFVRTVIMIVAVSSEKVFDNLAICNKVIKSLIKQIINFVKFTVFVLFNDSL